MKSGFGIQKPRTRALSLVSRGLREPVSSMFTHGGRFNKLAEKGLDVNKAPALYIQLGRHGLLQQACAQSRST